MVASRTGSTAYLRARRIVLTSARRQGLTHCPGYTDEAGVYHPCGVELDYVTPLLDNSAETDHIVEYRHGGTDDPSNLRVLCRWQNRERSRERAPVAVAPPTDFPVSQDW
ncbi:hypothetical protein CHO01_25330 [Cellulomonas hominis]|uniref:HNH domain-containing protein n=1 Tax=Cellulomonas hominis TaxID=156981 RepID=A0A511FGG4_9CELL|nr:HNH endonuclease [Cellulomonas hominis]MBB5472499.1 hypothetical protein [Cellulomonas hominis]NKY05521.1 HNH endonuclease [Cellulomonas hominis]GEL47417.1 hypothetical protein CHO01_25330 [Cellulomonas hominis]